MTNGIASCGCPSGSVVARGTVIASIVADTRPVRARDKNDDKNDARSSPGGADGSDGHLWERSVMYAGLANVCVCVCGGGVQ